jgi:hypothetical protein
LIKKEFSKSDKVSRCQACRRIRAERFGTVPIGTNFGTALFRLYLGVIPKIARVSSTARRGSHPHKAEPKRGG